MKLIMYWDEDYIAFKTKLLMDQGLFIKFIQPGLMIQVKDRLQ